MNNKGIMNSQKGNIIYRSFIIAVTVILLFFIVMTIKSNSSDYNLDYQTVLDFGENSYIIKVDNAAYIKDKKQFSFSILSKPSGVDKPTSSKPYISECSVFYKKSSNEVDVKKIKTETKSDMVQLFTIDDVKEDISYVYMLISIKHKDYKDPDTTDEFGQVKKGKKHKGSEETEMVQIDKSDIKYLNKSEYEKRIESAVKQADKFAMENNAESTTSTTVSATTKPVPNSSAKTTTATKNKSKKTTTKQTEPSYLTETDEAGGNQEPATTEVPTTQQPQTQPVHTKLTTKPQTQHTQTSVTGNGKPKTQTSTTHTTKKTTQAEPKTINVTGVELNAESLTLEVGKSYVLTANVIPSNAKNKNVKWNSFRPDIAKVNSNGVVTAVCSGMSIITVTTVDGEYSAECIVNVEEAE